MTTGVPDQGPLRVASFERLKKLGRSADSATRSTHTVERMTSRRLSRRSLITDFGAGGIGVIILGACAGSSDSAPSSETEPTGTPTTDAAPASSGEDDREIADQDPEQNPDNQLQLQHVSFGFVSAYILVRGNEAAIVDTGQSDTRDAILAGLDTMSVTPSMVRHVVLTHNHGDHVGGLAELEGDLTNASVYAGAADIGSIESSLTLSEVADGDEVFGMGVLATPGHTPGSISLFDTESGILVAGDAISGDEEGGLNGSPPDFTDDPDMAAESIAKLAALMPTTAAFGHGGPPVANDVSAKLAALV